MPVIFQTTFFDELLGFSISENINAKYADYNFVNRNLNKKWKNYHIYRNSHEINLYSDLVKEYENLTHYLNLSLMVNIPSFEKKGGERAPFINIEDNSKKVVLGLKHYFFNNSSETFYHRLTQEFNYEYDDKAQDMENEFGVTTKNMEMNLDIFYSHQRSNISAIKSQIRYFDDQSYLYLSHFYKNRIEGERDSNFLIADFRKVLSKKYELFATIEYDFVGSNTKSWSLGYRLNKKCWSYEISYKKDVLPLLTSEGNRLNENRTIYFKIEFYPLGGVSKSFSTTEEQRIF